MSNTGPILALFFCGALLAAAPTAAVLAEDSGVKKVMQQTDKAITGAVSEASKGLKKAAQEVDRAAKTGTEAVRRAAKGQAQ